MKERKKSAISKILEPSALRRMAGARSFERGEEYFATGQVGPLVEHEGKITAKVQGTRADRVSLWEEDGELEYSCTCPVGADAAFCKHCVALGLAWLEEGKKAHGKKPLKKAVTMEDVRGYLAGQDKKVLVELLMEQAVEDDRSEIERIFLWEKDVEAAWHEAQQGGCSNDLWMELAAKLEKDHPEDVLPIYLAQIEPTLARKNNDAYQTAVSHLRKVRGLMIRLGREAEFARHLASIRTAHKAKRNFAKLLDGVRW